MLVRAAAASNGVEGSDTKTVVVFGATGQVGSLVVEKIESNGNLVARAVVRDEEKAAATFEEGGSVEVSA